MSIAACRRQGAACGGRSGRRRGWPTQRGHSRADDGVDDRREGAGGREGEDVDTDGGPGWIPPASPGGHTLPAGRSLRGRHRERHGHRPHERLSTHEQCPADLDRPRHRPADAQAGDPLRPRPGGRPPQVGLGAGGAPPATPPSGVDVVGERPRGACMCSPPSTTGSNWMAPIQRSCRTLGRVAVPFSRAPRARASGLVKRMSGG